MPWVRIRSRRSTSIDSPRAPVTPRLARRMPVAITTRPIRNCTAIAATVRPLMSLCWVTDAVTHSRMKTTNHGRVRGPSRMAPISSGSIRLENGTSSGNT